MKNISFSQYIIKVTKNRDGFARALKEQGVSTGLHYIPLHLLTYYKKKYKLKITAYGNALNDIWTNTYLYLYIHL